jgi:hypothetical protein
MTAPNEKLSLYQGAVLSGLSYDEIWIRQATFGGTAGRLEIEAYILGLLRPDTYQHNLIAQALNEHFLEEGQDHPVAYSGSILS